MRWTDAQREAIEIRNKNVLVSAAAGSGKTAVLVERILQLIMKDRVPLDRMLIVTFSNAAASEMREKIVKAISKAVREENVDPKQRDFLRDQLSLIHQANISTFHAFAMEVIRRYFYLIDREPDFKICDEAQMTILQAEAMEELFHDLFEKEEADFLWFLKQYGQAKNENSVKEMIVETHSFIQSIPEPFIWLSDSVKALSMTKEQFFQSAAFSEIKEQIEEDLKSAKSYFLRAEQSLSEAGLSGLLKKCGEELHQIEEQIELFQRGSFESFAKGLANLKYAVYRPSALEKEDYGAIKTQISGYRDRGKGILKKLVSCYCLKSMDEYVAEMNETYEAAFYLQKLVFEFDERYRNRKAEKKLIDFSDIEHDALHILDHGEAAAEYREKFLHIFIDEYQDSNIVQETLINKIKGKNNVFMVGDVKQSIYKFRLAEPELFLEKYKQFAGNEKTDERKIDLNENFRSKGKVIDGVNDVFCHIMRRDVCGIDYDEAAALHKGVVYEGELNYRAQLHIADDKLQEDYELPEEIAEMKKVEVEAFTAAKLIKEAVGLPIYDGKKEKVRSLEYRDIVVLLRGAKNTADIYYEAFLKEGIPSFVDMGDGYFDTMEIEVLLNLLRIIDNCRQDIPLLSVLRSCIFSFTTEELITIRIQNKSGSYYDAFEQYALAGTGGELRNKCTAVLEQISKWNRMETYMNLEDLLWRLLRETCFYEFVGAIPAGIQRQANIRALIDKAVQFQSSQMKGLFDFIGYIDAVKKQKVPTGQVKLLGEKDDVVRIMTIHKSKGLEFPLVIVGGLGKRFVFGNRGTLLHLHRDMGIGMRLVDRKNHGFVKTILQTAIEQKKRKEDLAEEIRVLYVAFTRAMDQLILLGSVTDMEKVKQECELRSAEDVASARSYLDVLLPILSQTNIDFTLHDKQEIGHKRTEDIQNLSELYRLIKGDPPEQETSSEERRERSLWSVVDERFSFQYSYRQALSLKSKFTVSELNNQRKKGFHGSLKIPSFAMPNRGFTGAERGTILHKIMEYIPFQQTTETEVNSFIVSLVERGILTREESETAARDKIVAFMESPVGRRAARSPSLERELSFNLQRMVGDEAVIVQGTIDCCFLEEGEYVLVDYKSDYVGNQQDEEAISELVEGYRGQIAVYREALERIRRIRVKESYLYLFSIDRQVRL